MATKARPSKAVCTRICPGFLFSDSIPPSQIMGIKKAGVHLLKKARPVNTPIQTAYLLSGFFQSSTTNHIAS